MTTSELQALLMELASEMARLEGVPSHYRHDWRDLPPGLTKKGWAQIRRRVERCESHVLNWSVRLRRLAMYFPLDDSEDRQVE